MTLWDLYAVKQHFKNQKINNYNENDIFEAYEQLSQLENDVKERHTSFHKRKKSKKSIKRNELKKTLEEVKELSSSSHFDNLFNDIEIYDVTTEGKENE